MLYIKSYLTGNGENLTIKEARELECREFHLDLAEEYKKFNTGRVCTKEEAEKIIDQTFSEYVNGLIKGKFGIIWSEELISAVDDIEELKDLERNPQNTRTKWNLISYVDAGGEIIHFIPCGTTYIVNETGATIATLNRCAGCN